MREILMQFSYDAKLRNMLLENLHQHELHYVQLQKYLSRTFVRHTLRDFYGCDKDLLSLKDNISWSKNNHKLVQCPVKILLETHSVSDEFSRFL